MKAVRSKKKTLKLLVEHFHHIKVGQVHRVTPTDGAPVAGSTRSGQSDDAERAKLGNSDPLPEGNRAASSSGSRSSQARRAKCRKHELEIEAKIEAAKSDMQEASAKIKKDLMAEFPEVFGAPPDTLPPSVALPNV